MISAVIITFNEEQCIGRCIDSLKGLADEIVVIDSYSTDQTAAICLSRNARFITHAFEGYIQQKNFGVDQARHDYILSLDADECLSPELRQSILMARNHLVFDAYEMKRLNNFCGKWIYHSGWYPDKKIRLWNRNRGMWGGTNPHDMIIMESNSTKDFLKGDLLHYTVSSITQFIDQQKKFALIAAAEIVRSKKQSNKVALSFKSLWMFIRRYLFQLGILDGYYGWLICSQAAIYTYKKSMLANEMLTATAEKISQQ